MEKTLNELDRILIKAGKNGYSVLRKEWLDSKQVKQDEKGGYYAMIDKDNPPKSFVDFVGSGLGTKLLTSITENKVFNNPKPMTLIKHLLKISTTNPSDYVDLQADSMDCHEFANAKSHNAKGAYTNATTTGGGGKLAA